MKITVTLKGLVTKEFTVPTANILRKEAPAGMTFADQNVKITVRGRASVMSYAPHGGPDRYGRLQPPL